MSKKQIPKCDVTGGDIAIAAILGGLKPDPQELLSEWCDKYRLLNQTYAAEPGRYRVDRVPFLREILDAFSPSSRTEFVVLMKGAQLGFTEALTNLIGYVIHRAPAPMMLVMPTQNLGKRFSKQRLAPMISDMPILRNLVADPRSRDSSNTTLSKGFDGGVLFIAGANSASDLRSAAIRYLLLDEIDAYPYDLDGEGSAIELAINRTKTFARRKILIGSTPTIKDVSAIEREFLKGDQRKYHIPCIHCDEFQVLEWSNIKWNKDENNVPRPETAFYVCKHCGGVLEESDKQKMLLAGKWIAAKPENNYRDIRRSYHISSLYSPWETWATLVQKWLDAQADPHLLKTFVNTILGECWDDEANRVDSNDLQSKAEKYPLRVIPMGGLLVTAGIDTQDNRLECVLWAYGKDGQQWVIDHHVFFGDPSSPALWAELDEYLEKELAHESGESVKISAAAIDSGGHHTQRVYDFARTRRYRHVIAVKGSSTRNKPVISKPANMDVTFSGKTLKGGVQLWPVGTDTAKEIIYGKFSIEKGAGCMHFSHELEDEFYEQISAEKLITRYHKGFPRKEWVKPSHKRNEILDCTVYSLAAAYHLGMNKFSARDWKTLEDRVQPTTKDLFAANIDEIMQKNVTIQKKTPENEKVLVDKPAQRVHPRKEKAGFANNW